jgi:RNA polymerase sigma-70 factor (ECF subfamily)
MSGDSARQDQGGHLPDSAGPQSLRLDDRAAFRAFYRYALPRVYGYFLTRCGHDRATAEDLTQETFMAAVRSSDRHAVIAAPLPWIMAVARHKLLDHWRAAEREDRRLAAVEAAAATEAQSQLLPWDEAQGLEQASVALASVPSAQRTALVLHHVDGLSIRQVAEQLGRSTGAVESLLSRGRASFRAAYLEVCDA